MTAPARPADEGPRMLGGLEARRWALDLGATTLLLAVGIAGFWPTFGGPAYLPAAGGGLILGLAIAAVATWRRWGVLVIAGLTLAAYIVFGTVLAVPHVGLLGFIPTPESLWRLVIAIVTSWKELLTTVAPVGTGDSHLVVPFLLTLVAAVLVASLALRVRPPAWALVPAVAYLVGQIALGTVEPAAPIVQGVVFALVAAVWIAVRQAWQPVRAAISVGEGGEPTGMLARRLIAGAAVLAVATGAGVAAGAAAAPEGPRYVLRDVVIPPFDVRQYPSPLQSFRGYVRDFADEPLFTASGLPEGARIRLATMDAYTGTVFNVADDGAGSSSAFTPVRSIMSPEAEGTPATIRIEIEGMRGVWLPDAGAVRSVEFDGPRADELRRSAYYNDATGTGVVTMRLGEGDAYTLETLLPGDPSDERLADEKFAPLRMPKQKGVPPEFAEIASEIVGDAATPIEQVRALEQTLSQDGFFSHGLEGQVLSRAGHGAERIATLLRGDQWIGDDEQYAVTMALLAGQLGIPARVVMGFYPEEDAAGGLFTATGETLHAWVEVAFDESGWVAFDPTPPEDQVPTDQTTKPRADPKPQVLQPPPPEQEPVDLPPTVPDERGAEDEENPLAGILGLIAIVLASIVGVLALLLGPFLVVGALKAARRRRRREAERPADRISGGWDELIDRASDYGTPVRRGGTRAEDASVVSTAFEQPQVATLARRADAEVFGPSDPTPAEIEEFWHEVDGIVGGMGQRVGFWRRLKGRLDVRSLLAGTRFALPDRRITRTRLPRPARAAASSGDAPGSAPARPSLRERGTALGQGAASQWQRVSAAVRRIRSSRDEGSSS
ncbi:transglutaminase domain-containing protein [Microbacterium lushaniae]|nr:transglutaminase domain-containing protein [Microbacterium lushaniae]KAA9155438.1 transglutaminase domain-containing protein [Microbacterium lushaniae]